MFQHIFYSCPYYERMNFENLTRVKGGEHELRACEACFLRKIPASQLSSHVSACLWVSYSLNTQTHSHQIRLFGAFSILEPNCISQISFTAGRSDQSHHEAQSPHFLVRACLHHCRTTQNLSNLNLSICVFRVMCCNCITLSTIDVSLSCFLPHATVSLTSIWPDLLSVVFNPSFAIIHSSSISIFEFDRCKNWQS